MTDIQFGTTEWWDDTFDDRYPFVWNELGIFIGSPGTHHHDLEQEFNFSSSNSWGEIQKSYVNGRNSGKWEVNFLGTAPPPELMQLLKTALPQLNMVSYTEDKEDDPDFDWHVSSSDDEWLYEETGFDRWVDGLPVIDGLNYERWKEETGDYDTNARMPWVMWLNGQVEIGAPGTHHADAFGKIGPHEIRAMGLISNGEVFMYGGIGEPMPQDKQAVEQELMKLSAVPDINDWKQDWSYIDNEEDRKAMDERIPWIIDRDGDIQWGVPGTHHMENWGNTWDLWKGSIQGGKIYVYSRPLNLWEDETPESIQARVRQEQADFEAYQKTAAEDWAVPGFSQGLAYKPRYQRLPWWYNDDTGELTVGPDQSHHTNIGIEWEDRAKWPIGSLYRNSEAEPWEITQFNATGRGGDMFVEETDIPDVSQIVLEIFNRSWNDQDNVTQKLSAIPAEYSDMDPYDLAGKQPMIQSLQREWWKLPKEQKQLAVANAIRATLLSPQLELKWNAVAYQALMAIPATESNPDAYEGFLREWKRKFDNPGQLDLEGGEGHAIEEVLPGNRMNPPFWKNVRGLAELAPHIDALVEAAEKDVAAGGEGFIWRDAAMQVPGVGPKVASFAWLLLMPTTSELATIDLWMARHLDVNSIPSDPGKYMELEQRLSAERDQLYPGVPLGQYQWAVWDSLRTEGFHQPHDPFAVHEPTPFNEVEWSGPSAIQRALNTPNVPEPLEGQMAWAKTASDWEMEGEGAAYAFVYCPSDGAFIVGEPNGVHDDIIRQHGLFKEERDLTYGRMFPDLWVEGDNSPIDMYLGPNMDKAKKKAQQWLLQNFGHMREAKTANMPPGFDSWTPSQQKGYTDMAQMADEWSFAPQPAPEIGITEEEAMAVIHRFDHITPDDAPEVDGYEADQMEELWREGWTWKFVISGGSQAAVAGCGEVGMYDGWYPHSHLWDDISGEEPHHDVDGLGWINKPAMKSGDQPFKITLVSGFQLTDAQVLATLGLSAGETVIERRDYEGIFGVERFGKLYDWKSSSDFTEEEIPPAPGTAPVPDGYVRLFHYTIADPAILKEQGLRISEAKGNNYGEPNRIWASAQFPKRAVEAGQSVVEFAVPVLDSRWDIGKYDERIKYDGQYGIEAYLEYIKKRGTNVTFYDDISPSEFIAVHERWHEDYRYMVDEVMDPNQFGWIEETAEQHPDLAKAFELYKQRLGASQYQVIEGTRGFSGVSYKDNRRPGLIDGNIIYLGPPGAFHQNVRNEFPNQSENYGGWIELWNESYGQGRCYITTSVGLDWDGVAKALSDHFGKPITVGEPQQSENDDWRLAQATPQQAVPRFQDWANDWRDNDESNQLRIPWCVFQKPTSELYVEFGEQGTHHGANWDQEELDWDAVAHGSSEGGEVYVYQTEFDAQEIQILVKEKMAAQGLDTNLARTAADLEDFPDSVDGYNWEEYNEARQQEIADGRVPDFNDWDIDWGENNRDHSRYPWIITQDGDVEFGEQGTHHHQNWDDDMLEREGVEIFGSAQGDKVYIYQFDAVADDPHQVMEKVKKEMDRLGLDATLYPTGRPGISSVIAATDNVIHHDVRQTLGTRWAARVPYLYDVKRDLLHIGTPGASHGMLYMDGVEPWYTQHEIDIARDQVWMIQGAYLNIPNKPHGVREPLDDEVIPVEVMARLEELIGAPILHGDPDYLVDFYMEESEPLLEDDWSPQIAK